MIGLIGKKIGMTSVFRENGTNVACTVIQAGPCYVTQIKTKEKEGYSSLQLAFDDKKQKDKDKNKKQLPGHFKKAGVSPKRKLVEFKNFEGKYKLGDQITLNLFKDTPYVDIAGISKGKGFQGVVKRHGFHGVGDQTHGQHNRLRAPGSIGASSDPSKVIKGIRMAGQTGNKRVSLANLRVIKVIPDNNLLVVRGAVPGYNGSYLIIKA